jgi:hypothetical protein
VDKHHNYHEPRAILPDRALDVACERLGGFRLVVDGPV